MKYFVFLGILWLSLVPAAHAQTTHPDSLAQTAAYQQVVPVPGASADDLYARVREWVALTFDDVHHVVQLDDPARHLLIGSGFTRGPVRRANGKVAKTMYFWFRFRVEARPGRYRIEFSDFGTVQEFHGGQYAGQDIAFWLAASHATRAASIRHSAPGGKPAWTPKQQLGSKQCWTKHWVS